MKNFLLLVLLILGMDLSAQSVRGLYQGKLFNDTLKVFQNYELALSEYRGKIMGYSYTTFVSNDTFYYGVRRIKAHIENDQLIVEDAEFIGHNYPEPPAKGVKRVSVIPLNGQDSVVNLSGKWQTNQTKRYFSIPGSIDLRKTEDSSASELITHLKQMNIIREAAQTGDVAQVKPKSNAKTEKAKADASKNDVAKSDVTPKKESRNEVVQKDNNSSGATNPNASLAVNSETASTDTKRGSRSKSQPKAETAAIVKTEAPKPVTRMPVEERKENPLPPVSIAADSLVLAFYDNGIVDGDSVSVYLNGEIILPATKLTAFATKKTIYLPKVEGEYKLVLVAENLGTLPPNTGLLVVRDGETSYQMNFKADLVTNATLLIRRKK